MKVSKCEALDGAYTVTNNGLGMVFDSVGITKTGCLDLAYQGNHRGCVFSPLMNDFLTECVELGVPTEEKE